MRAMVLRQPGQPLQLEERPNPEPGPGEVRLRVAACGVCRTDLHVVDGELRTPLLPLIPGHEIVGTVDRLGAGVDSLHLGDRVGVPWLAHSCGACDDCIAGHENLCDHAIFTGHGRNGGYATHTLADARFCVPVPATGDAVRIAPLLCAGLIGWRALRMAGAGKRLGLYGFGASAHLIAQVAAHQGREVYAFTRPCDAAGQAFSKTVGCVWAGGSDEMPPQPLDAAIIFAPDGGLVPRALAAVRKGGRVVCAGIHMSDIPSFPYALLWGERQLCSVANLTRSDASEFMAFVAHSPLRVEATAYPLQQANDALAALREGRIHGAAVLVP